MIEGVALVDGGVEEVRLDFSSDASARVEEDIFHDRFGLEPVFVFSCLSNKTFSHFVLG